MNKCFFVDIKEKIIKNDNYREVLYTSKRLQLIIMSLNPGEEIDTKINESEQFIRIEKGTGKMIISDVINDIKDNSTFLVQSNTKYNLINNNSEKMKLCIICSPPIYKDKLVQSMKPIVIQEQKKKSSSINIKK
jgi:mannose-6-phosphate isomerase-like protein (cupin superfamily)